MQERRVNPVYDQNKEDSWGVGMTTLCAATNTTLDDYYNWDIPALKEGAVQERLASIKGPSYSNELHDFIQKSLDFSEETRASLDDHEKFLRSYQKEANEVTLDFKKRGTTSTVTG